MLITVSDSALAGSALSNTTDASAAQYGCQGACRTDLAFTGFVPLPLLLIGLAFLITGLVLRSVRTP